MKMSIYKRQRILIKFLLFIVISAGYLILYQSFKIKELSAEKTVIMKDIEEMKTFIKNVKESMSGPGESKYEKTKYYKIIKEASNKTENYYYLLNMTDNQKRLNYEMHGKSYILRYDWMINPVENGYCALKGCEFGTPRIDSIGNIWAHTGWDQGSVDSLKIKSVCNAIVIDAGWNELGGYYVITKTEKTEYNMKLKKDEKVIYENYYGHLSAINVMKQQVLIQGGRIGLMGNTGKDCKGLNLHWSIKRNGILINPVINSTWGIQPLSSIKESNYNY